MATTPSHKAWNNFIMSSVLDRPAEREMHAAAIAKFYMNGVNSGGVNSFLTNSWEFDAREVLDELWSIGAVKAAKELQFVLDKLGAPLPPSSQEQRWQRLEFLWPASLDDFDSLIAEAELELMHRLEEHVTRHQHIYEGL